MHRPRQSASILTDAIMCIIGLGWCVGFSLLNRNVRDRELAEARAHYVEVQQGSLTRQLARIEEIFRDVYSHLRTIARLPGVRNIATEGKNFDDDAKATVQEIYNNLAENVALSEIYIVPSDLDPDQLNPGQPGSKEPIVSFDELIVGKLGVATPEGTTSPVSAHTDTHNEAHHEVVEEVEIFEYRLIRNQLSRFRQVCPSESSIDGLAYPTLTGPQVVTCDNSLYDPRKPDDEARSGIIISVPFFGPDGKLRGCISAIMLTRRISDMVGDPDIALVNTYTGIYAPGQSRDPGMCDELTPLARRALPVPGAVYSEVRPMTFGGEPGWTIWTAKNSAEFLSSPSVNAINRNANIGQISAVAIPLIFLSVLGLIRRNHRLVRNQNALLEERVAARTTELEEATRLAMSASKAKSDFLANMSHEIRTPMAAILGYADLLGESLSKPTDDASNRIEYLGTIRRNGDHLLSIINDILDLSKIEAGKMTVERIPLSTSRLLQDVTSLVRVRAKEKGLLLELQAETEIVASLNSDPIRLKQILLNLVSNAIKFTESGRVMIQTGLIDPGDRTTRVYFKVTDSGVGMSPEQLDRLFEAFHQADTSVTRKFGGTGLGLCISKSLAAMLGAQISVTSELGRGSTFTLSLPVEVSASTPMITADQMNNAVTHSRHTLVRQTNSADAPPLEGLRVILAEDGPDNQRLISFHLRKAGAIVRIADNGSLALAMLTDDATPDGPLADPPAADIVITDMQMPVMDGYTFAAALRAKGWKRPIIALTAHAMSGDEQKCIAAGCNAYGSKPIDRNKLICLCLEHPSSHSTGT
jgi:signal transduction histidine kinase